METFRCPTCLFVLADPGQKRCPSCHKRLRRRGQPIVLGDKPKFGSHEPTVNVVITERADRLGVPPEPWAPPVAPIDAFVGRPPAVTSSSVLVPPVYAAPIRAVVDDAVVAPAAMATEHTTIFQPSQFDPEMRQVLDDLYRKARSATDD